MFREIRYVDFAGNNHVLQSDCTQEIERALTEAATEQTAQVTAFRRGRAYGMIRLSLALGAISQREYERYNARLIGLGDVPGVDVKGQERFPFG